MTFRLWLEPGALEGSGANPVIVFLLFIVRCLVPLAVMLGLSYLLRRFGWIKEPAPPLPPPPPAGGEDRPSGGSQGGY
jgi:hypothetical protein